MFEHVREEIAVFLFELLSMVIWKKADTSSGERGSCIFCLGYWRVHVAPISSAPNTCCAATVFPIVAAQEQCSGTIPSRVNTTLLKMKCRHLYEWTHHLQGFCFPDLHASSNTESTAASILITLWDRRCLHKQIMSPAKC